MALRPVYARAHRIAYMSDSVPEFVKRSMSSWNRSQNRSLISVAWGDGVIVLTDAFGATPGNIATQLNQPGKVAVVAGVNLPMLLRTLCYREGTLAATVDTALAGGTQGVMQVASTAVQNQGFKPQGNDLARIHHQQ